MSATANARPSFQDLLRQAKQTPWRPPIDPATTERARQVPSQASSIAPVESRSTSTTPAPANLIASLGSHKRPRAEPSPPAVRADKRSRTDTADVASSDITAFDPTPPKWYKDLDNNTRKKQNNQSVSKDNKLRELSSSIDKCKKVAGTPAFRAACDAAMPAVHAAVFVDVTPELLRTNYLLHPRNGLAVLITPEAPWYAQNDALELFNKWYRQIFTTNLLHGIKQDSESAKLDPKAPRYTTGNKTGANGLIVGQWVPTQLCLVRDGAHSSAQGGISGRAGIGAYSVVMSGGFIDKGNRKERYPNQDYGERVLYCGTDGTDGHMSENTALLLSNIESGTPVRFIRSHKAQNKDFAPEAGFRYDGLYNVVSFEILDSEVQRHRFELVRCQGQLPIRCSGPGKRPMKQELVAYNKIKVEKKFLVNDDDD